MSNVKRYDVDWMTSSDTGEVVKHEDYESLAAENKRLIDRVAELEGAIINHCYLGPPVDDSDRILARFILKNETIYGPVPCSKG